MNLRKTGQGWEFENEAALEDFVWANLNQLLKLTPLKRQYSVKGQICDILAVDENKRLVVLELKNGEDRYIVQQLTRYYDALREEKLFKEKINYEQPISLLAVAPSFHRDNFIDRKYNNLAIEFLLFVILADEEKFYLQLKNIETEKALQLEISHHKTNSTDNLPSPPRGLITLLSKFTDADREVLLQIRQKLLSFDNRMQETSASTVISYGKGKKVCAEFSGHKSLCGDKGLLRPSLILYLPSYPRAESKRIGRMIIYRRAFDDKPCLSYIDEYSSIDYKPKASRSHSANSSWNVKNYIRMYCMSKGDEVVCLENLNYLEFLVDVALSEWLKKL